MKGWTTDTKNSFDDLEVYMEYGYVFVSSTGRNHAKMAYSLFKYVRCVDISPAIVQHQLIVHGNSIKTFRLKFPNNHSVIIDMN